MSKPFWNRVATACAVLPALLLAPAFAGERLSARVDEPFEVDGRFFTSGTLTLRHVADYSPVATLNEVCIDAECLGIFLAQETRGAAVSSKDALVFFRAADGHLVLQALALSGMPQRELYGYEPGERGWRTAHAHGASDPLLTSRR